MFSVDFCAKSPILREDLGLGRVKRAQRAARRVLDGNGGAYTPGGSNLIEKTKTRVEGERRK